MGLLSSRPKILPEPPGPFGVGCADIMTDSKPRGLLVRIFYPTEKVSLQDKIDNLPLWIPKLEYIDGFASYTKRNVYQTRTLFSWFVGSARIAALWHRTIVPRELCATKFPVVVFTHGMAGNRFVYSSYCCNLASQGFVVAAVEHRDRSASWTFRLETQPDGQTIEKGITYQHPKPFDREFKFRNPQLNIRVDECMRTLHLLEEINMGHCKPPDQSPKGSKILLGADFDWNQFLDRLDTGRAAVVGHSFGGASAIAATASCSDFSCAVVLDPWMLPIHRDSYSKLSLPILCINSQLWQWKENLEKIEKLTSDEIDRPIFTVKDSCHHAVDDFQYLVPGFVGRKMKFVSDIEPILAGEINAQMSVAFLRKHMGLEGDPLNELYKQYAQWIIPSPGVKAPCAESIENENMVRANL